VKPLLLLAILSLAACRGGEAEPPKNEASRLTEQIQKQGEQIAKQADNGAAAIEQALENESAIVFENRGNLLNETTDNAAAPRQ
jgi:outer membrane biogenesis lipoprotein LolB